jgi:opacity protein-like surface antigen
MAAMDRALITAAGLLLAAASAAAADAVTPKAELFGGYSYTKSDDVSLNGGEVSLGVSLGRGIGVEADLSSHLGDVFSVSTRRFFYMGGLRFTYRTSGLALFARALAGGVRSRSGITVQGVDITESRTDFGLAFGGGADVRLSGHWAVRVQGDYVMISADGETEKEPRLAAGAVYRFGSR